MIARFVALGALALCAGVAPVAGAQEATPAPSPTPIVLPTLPPSSNVAPYIKAGIDYLNGLVRTREAKDANAASGKVSYFKRFEMQVQTGPNGYRDVHLHQGTIIDPRGASLASGQRVSITGSARPDGSLDANVITILQ